MTNMSDKKKILLVFGTRPEAIKMAPLCLELARHKDAFITEVCVTGQHREMLDQVLHLFGITPDYDLNVMRKNQDLYDLSARVLTGMRDVLDASQPDVVLVHGDTATSTMAALAAFYRQIAVGHVEAGLRTRNIYSPWPEEMNRQITSRIATYHFAPTELSRQNLLDENVSDEHIWVTGNTVIDALHLMTERIGGDESLQEQLAGELRSQGYDIGRLATGERRLVLITGHRRESFGEPFLNICRAIRDLAARYEKVDFVYPMHLNPNVRKPIHEVFGEDLTKNENLFFIEPLDYAPFTLLMARSHVVLTDSGGIQEEAPGLGIPVVVMRDTTERPEAVTAGTVRLVGANYERIMAEMTRLLDDAGAYRAMASAVNPYGDGHACERITRALLSVTV